MDFFVTVLDFPSVFIFLHPFIIFFFSLKIESSWEIVHRLAKEAGCIFFLLEKSFG